MPKPLLSICCVTYNHENFIRQCLDGFVMQQTNFPFEILVHEDASTDNTANIVKEFESEYPYLFRCVYQTENQFAIQNTLVNILFPMARGKYIAICEGDDYYCKDNHLQTLFDSFEQDQSFGFAASTYISIDNSLKTKATLKKKNKYFAEDIFLDRPFHVSSSLYRRSDIFDFIDFCSQANDPHLIFDKNIMLACAQNREIGVIDNRSFMYRFQNGITAKGKKIQEYLIPANKIPRQLFIIKHYNIKRNIKEIMELDLKLLEIKNLTFFTKLPKVIALLMSVLRINNRVIKPALIIRIIKAF